MLGKLAGAVLLVVVSAMGALGDPGPVKVLSTKRDIFYFKVDKALVGSTLEVFDKDGNKIIEQQIDKRKVLVDFYYDQPGRYSIRITNGTLERLYVYEKVGPSHAERFSGDFVLVTEY